jgi:hypothetical protein
MMETTTFVEHQDAIYTESSNANGHAQRKFGYFGKSTPHASGPEAFLVDFGPDRTSIAHFHSVDQFQIFFGAPGARYQRRSIPAVEVHYSDAFVTYGPFSAGGERFRFFTLRACQGQYKGRMPRDRRLLRYQGRRGIHVDLEPLLVSDPGHGEVSVRQVIERQDDGLSASLIVAGPATDVVLDSTDSTSGRYLVVLSGGSVTPGCSAPLALGWTDPNQRLSVFRTAASGVTRLLSLTFPSPPTPEARAL